MAAVVASTLHYALLRPIAKIELVDSTAARVPAFPDTALSPQLLERLREGS